MKYFVIIPDGMSDYPLDELNGQTPLEAAATPNLDAVCREGRLLLVNTTCSNHPPGSDVATMCLLGYDPDIYYTGRAPLEAASMGIQLGPKDVAIRCNLVTVNDGVLVDYSAGAIPTEEAHLLIAAIDGAMGSPSIRFFPGVSYRNLLVLKDAEDFAAATFPPHDVMGKRLEEIWPSGQGSDILLDLTKRSLPLLEEHPVNKRRSSQGLPAANMIWLWGAGTRPAMPGFKELHGCDGAVIAAVDLVKGLGRVIGWQVINVKGATGDIHTNYEGKAAAGIDALNDFDFVLVHVEAPDEAGHAGNAEEKIKAIENVDRLVIGPVRDGLSSFPQFRLLILPDHPTPIPVRTHVKAPVPAVICGTGIGPDSNFACTEANAERNGLRIDRGFKLMDYFIRLAPA